MSQITDQVKERLNIVDVVQEYLPELKKMGANWKGRCPFHQEKTPSFMVSADKQIWHCFGCGKGGDVFGFIKEIEGIEFPDALRLLAKRAGVTLERQNPEADSRRTRVLEILRTAALWYHKALLSAKSGDYARSYVASRNISAATRDEWQLGFAPDAWEGLLTYLRSRGFREDEISETGLSIPSDRGGYYDRFRNRLMFPIRDVHGSIIGFTGRKLAEDEAGGKYINTPETSVYHKSEVLFGLSRAKQQIRTEKLAVVVEGNMDCISSHQAGIAHVVAASGTALTPEQIRLLKRYTQTVALAFDPDAAGQQAALRGLEVAWQEDMVIKVIPLPPGEDPDDLIKRDSALWRERIAKAQDVMEWLFASTEKQHDVTSAIGKKAATKMLVPWIQRMPDLVVQTHYIQKLALLVHVDDSVIRDVVGRKAQPARPVRPTSPKETPVASVEAPRGVLDKIAMRLFGLVLAEETKVPLHDFDPTLLPNEPLKTLYKSLDFFYDDDASKSTDAWIETLPQDVRGLGREVLLIADELASTQSHEERQKEQDTLQYRLAQAFYKETLASLRLRIREAEASGDVDVVDALLKEWQETNKIYRELSS